jgi:signal transduction histidine kinase
MSAVFSALLQNAIDASRPGEVVEVSSALREDSIQMEVHYHDGGLSAEELQSALEPSFRVDQGRVKSCNWSMFSARQIVREHGGDIAIRSAAGSGTRVQVTLPAAPAGPQNEKA